MMGSELANWMLKKIFACLIESWNSCEQLWRDFSSMKEILDSRNQNIIVNYSFNINYLYYKKNI